VTGPAPVLAVVGHVNRGKSSIVSTLSADESVRIAADPGTTRFNQQFPLRLGGETLYTLVDTPGFERARHVLHWLRQHETRTADRRGVVERFVREHAGGEVFAQECELLRPILEGALILYVVDGGAAPSPVCEAETEILRWTGQPRMALINPIGSSAHAEEWRKLLDQYFGLVRTFDAHQADLEARVGLLRALTELSEAARPQLQRAVDVLVSDRAARVRESAGRIADALADLLTARDELRLAADEDLEQPRAELSRRFLEKLRERELRLRSDLRRVYLREGLQVTQESIERVDEDLFATDTWSRLGLSRTQLLTSGAAAGALIGGGVDVAVGGASFLMGTAVGGLIGLASTLIAWDRLVDVRVLGAALGGQLLCIGPIRNPNFGWVVLDRALIFERVVANHAHARREPIDLAGRGGLVRTLGGERRKRIASAFRELGRAPAPEDLARLRLQLAGDIEGVLRDEEPTLRQDRS
jgi:hypothetical protein